MTWKPDVVCYHGPVCDDGYTAAWAAFTRWPDEDILYIPSGYDDPTPIDAVRGKNVLIVDFSFKCEEMRKVGRAANSVVVLDHHKSAKAELHEWGSSTPPRDLGKCLEMTDFEIAHCLVQNGLPIIAWFDMEKSGARMSWEFCHPGEPVPQFVLHVEDRDLFRFALPGTAEISAAIRSYDKTWANWSALEENLEKLKDEGHSILRAHRKTLHEILAQTAWVYIGPYRVPSVNAPYHFASDAAHELLKAHPEAPFAVSWFRRADRKIQFSLRSENSRVDVSQVATERGGGGHRNAAAFSAEASAFWIINGQHYAL